MGNIEMPNSRSYGVDAQGFIVTQVAESKIPLLYRPLIDDVKNTFRGLIGAHLHGIHIYGSVAAGLAKAPMSDLDVLIVLRHRPNEQLTLKIRNAEADLTQTYAGLVREVGVGVTFLAEIESDHHGIGCFLKHLCICVFGEKIQHSLPSFKPTRQVAKAFNGDFERVLEKYRYRVTAASPDETPRLGHQISRKFVRTGFSLVTAREKSWTTDPQMSCDAFARHYPDKAADMQLALRFSGQPNIEKRELMALLDGFGNWLAMEVEREFFGS
ncbi:MAG: nucleotidyltransferase domain-containing protein [Pseudomonadota bacterium]